MPEHYAICPLCEATCGLKVSTEGGRVRTIRGDAEDPFSQGYICPKGSALKALVEDPDRLRQPMVRHGSNWKAVGWDEAFALIQDRLPPLLQAHGRDSLALYLGNPNVHNLSGQLYLPVLARLLESRNIYSASTLDQMPKHVSCGLMFGDPMSIPIPDLDRTHYLLILGANPLVSNGSLMTAPNIRVRLQRIRQRGGKIVVLDPRRTRTADEADEHHFIRPGGDAYFLLGLIHTLFAENLTRPGEHVHGSEIVAVQAADFPPERVAPICGLEAATIRRLARELAEAPSAAVYGRLGTCTQPFGTLVSWLIDVINVLTGHLDRPGGAMFPKAAAGAKNTSGRPGQGRGFRVSSVRSRVRGLPQVNGELPTVTLADEILTPGEGQVRALMTVAGNPALSVPNSDRLAQALGGLEFMLSVDCYVNETTRFAHVILPVPGPMQRAHYDLVFAQLAVHNQARYSFPVFELDEGQMDEWQIILRLAAIVGGLELSLEQLDTMVARQLLERELKIPGSPIEGRSLSELLSQELRGPERLLDILLRVGPYGDAFGARAGGLSLASVQAGPIDLGPLQPRLPEVLRTHSGKIELGPAELVADLQRLHTLPKPAEFVLIGRRELRSNNSWMHNLPPLVKGPSMCTLLMHPEDAQRLGLVSGDRVTVSSPAASVEIPVQVSQGIMPGVVSIPHGWGHGAKGAQLKVAGEHAGVNVNRLLSDVEVDPLSGNAIQNGVAVRLERSLNGD